MGGPKAKPPSLPRGAPQELKDFVACKRLSVELDLATIGWLPTPKGVPKALAPSITATAGAAPNTATVSVGYGGGMIAINLPVSVTAGGQLAVDTTNVPNLEGMKAGIDDWVQKFNDALAANGKRLSGLTVNGTKITLTKVAAGAGQAGAATTPATPAPAPAPPTGTTPTPQPPAPAPTPAAGDGEGATGKGCLIGILGLLLTGAVGTGIYFGVRGDDEPARGGEESSGVTEASVAVTSTTEATERPAATTTTAAEPTTTTAAATTTTESPTDCNSLDFAIDWSVIDAPNECDWSGPVSPCDPSRLSCPEGLSSPLIVAAPVVAITHDGGPPDPSTGLSGPSQAAFSAFISFGDPGQLTVQSNCGGNVITGEAPYTPGTVGTVAHSLFQYGPCTGQSLTFDAGDTHIDLWGANPPSFTVGPTEVAPSPLDPSGWGANLDRDRWGDYSMLALDAIIDDELACIGAVLDAPPLTSTSACIAAEQPTWTMHVPSNAAAGGIGAIGAGYLNALGSAAATPVELGGYSTEPIWSEPGLFPCGHGPIGYTICPAGVAPRAEAGGYLAIALSGGSGVWPGEITIDLGSGSSTIDIDLDPYGFTATNMATPTVVVAERALYILVPDPQVAPGATVKVAATDEGQTIEYAPVAVDNVLTLPALMRGSGSATTTTAAAPAAEDLSLFFQQLSQSLAVGDSSFALARLHPKVIETFGQDACNETVPRSDDTSFNISFVSEGEHGLWQWPLPDGSTIAIEDAVTVDVEVTQRDVTIDQQVHVVLLDNTWRWFTHCVP